jgi:hypothetical protein
MGETTFSELCEFLQRWTVRQIRAAIFIAKNRALLCKMRGPRLLAQLIDPALFNLILFCAPSARKPMVVHRQKTGVLPGWKRTKKGDFGW